MSQKREEANLKIALGLAQGQLVEKIGVKVELQAQLLRQVSDCKHTIRLVPAKTDKLSDFGKVTVGGLSIRVDNVILHTKELAVFVPGVLFAYSVVSFNEYLRN